MGEMEPGPGPDEYGMSVDDHDEKRRRLMGYDSAAEAADSLERYLVAQGYVRNMRGKGFWFDNMNRQMDNGIDLTERQVASVLMCVEAEAREMGEGEAL